MNSLKPLILLAILGGVGFGVYRSLNKGSVEPPPGADTSVTAVPQIKLGDPKALGSDSSVKTAGPNLLQPAPGSAAPPYKSATPTVPANEIAPAFSGDPSGTSSGDAAALANPAFAGGESGSSGPAERNPFGAGSQPAVNDSAGSSNAVAPAGAPAGASSFGAAWGTIQPKLAAGQLAEALRDLTVWYNHPSLTLSEREMVNRLLNQLAGSVIYSREHLLAPPHRVLAGETLADIAARQRVTPELLAKINGLDPAAPAVQPGDVIKVIPGPFSAVVDVGADRLTLMLDGCYAGSFSLAELGKTVAARLQSGTPVEYSVTHKTSAPIYNSAQGEIEAGDPANPLGDYLLVLSGELAIHGTNPKAASQIEQPLGGIRVSAADIGDVYDILTVGSRVIVRK